MNRIEPLGVASMTMTLPLGKAARVNLREFGDFLLIAPFLLLLLLVQHWPTPRSLCDLIKGVGALRSGRFASLS